jgi:hypothetical protein
MDLRCAVAALAALGLGYANVAAAQPDDGEPRRFVSLTFENDFFAGADSHYTNGLQVAMLVDRGSLPRWLDGAPPVRWSTDREVMFAIGQRIYTPSDTDRLQADPLDRPYAGWLYLLMDVRTQSAGTIDHTSVCIGVIGPDSYAHQVQNGIHRLLGNGTSNGWNSQLGTEPTLMVSYERAWPGVLRDAHNEWDVTPRAGAAVGSPMTYANAGVVARWGRNLPADVPVTHISLGPPRDGYRGSLRSGWYFWLGLDGRAVARNAFVDGNFWKDSPSVDRKPFGYDAQLGAAAAWASGRIGFTFVRRSAEFRGQKGADRFGQLAISFPY